MEDGDEDAEEGDADTDVDADGGIESDDSAAGERDDGCVCEVESWPVLLSLDEDDGGEKEEEDETEKEKDGSRSGRALRASRCGAIEGLSGSASPFLLLLVARLRLLLLLPRDFRPLLRAPRTRAGLSDGVTAVTVAVAVTSDVESGSEVAVALCETLV